MTEKPKTATEPVAADPVLKNTAKAEDEDAKLVLVNPAGTTDEEEDPETPYLASDMYKRVVTLINKFEEDLPDDLQAVGRQYHLFYPGCRLLGSEYDRVLRRTGRRFPRRTGPAPVPAEPAARRSQTQQSGRTTPGYRFYDQSGAGY